MPLARNISSGSLIRSASGALCRECCTGLSEYLDEEFCCYCFPAFQTPRYFSLTIAGVQDCTVFEDYNGSKVNGTWLLEHKTCDPANPTADGYGCRWEYDDGDVMIYASQDGGLRAGTMEIRAFTKETRLSIPDVLMYAAGFGTPGCQTLCDMAMCNSGIDSYYGLGNCSLLSFGKPRYSGYGGVANWKAGKYELWVLGKNYVVDKKVSKGGDNLYYDCIKNHYSQPVNEPGVGVDWEEFWNDVSCQWKQWTNGTDYVFGDRVTNGGYLYWSKGTHTSTPATEPDVGAGWYPKWNRGDAC
jgi:hypothetical protein